jgi:hypothetical protein
VNIPDLVGVALANRLGGEEKGFLDNGKWGALGMVWERTLSAGAVPLEPFGTVILA